jgi:RsiW-degrading membrane proteinase PrsW (M82 family)
MYVLRFQAVSPNIALYRGVLSVPAHTLFAVSMGYYLSRAKYTFDPVLKKRYFRKSLTVPVVLHGIYDFILFVGTPTMLAIFIPYVIYMWINGIKKLKVFAKMSKDSHT